MLQSVEALLDPVLDASVREEWARLLEAGLPSQARHTGASNAPHVTLAVAERIGADADARLPGALPADLPTVRLGGLLVLPGRSGRCVLARSVVVSAGLLDLHARVLDEVGDEPGVLAHVRPDAWTPHVTLAHRLDVGLLPAALAALADVGREREGRVGGVRRWDPEAQETWLL
ncbi:2'-5' RNA ligase family protein [uncultured Aeromicrobium sp.]|uniref:2'-5' RNA ligase family protein n=1 Tax=Aeromicrobium sp. TaxID=1871063 RepID=UPI000AA24F4B|nr:2'-5' RNA ligase family protein [uncultured Aeromicrobium sp.]